MTEKDKAKQTILKFVDDWFTKQAEYEKADPDAYEGTDHNEWTLWFWESGGDL